MTSLWFKKICTETTLLIKVFSDLYNWGCHSPRKLRFGLGYLFKSTSLILRRQGLCTVTSRWCFSSDTGFLMTDFIWISHWLLLTSILLCTSLSCFFLILTLMCPDSHNSNRELKLERHVWSETNGSFLYYG